MPETFKERQARGARPEPGVNVVTSEMEFAAMNAGRQTITQSEIPGEGDGLTGKSALTPAGIVTHKRPGTVVMYKPDGHGHFTPRIVPVTAIQQNILSGFKAQCPECNGHHGSSPNDCPAREPVAVRVCPVCQKRIYDNLDAVAQPLGADDVADANVIDDAAYHNSTPATRTKVMLDTHIWARHPASARIIGLDPLPELASAMGQPLGPGG